MTEKEEFRGPPPDLSPDELWAKMCETPRASEVVPFPRKDPTTGKALTHIRIEVLGETDHTKARIEGRARIMREYNLKSEELNDHVLREVVADSCAREVLKVACKGVKPINENAEKPTYPYMFANDERLNALTASELSVLFNMYELVQHKYGPFVDSAPTDEEMNAWIKVLSEGAKHHFLAHRSSLQLAELVIFLARRAYLLSLIVESLLKDSQSISAAALNNLGIGKSWFTGLRLTPTGTGLTLSDRMGVQPGDGAETLDEVLQDFLYTKPEEFEPPSPERAAEVARRKDE